MTEFGAEANRPGLPTEKGTFEFQRDFLGFHLNVIGQMDFLNGALVWILRDFRVKPGYDGGNPQPTPALQHEGPGRRDRARASRPSTRSSGFSVMSHS